MKDNSERTTINVLLVKAGECAKMIEMEDSLEAMQKIVGGMIAPEHAGLLRIHVLDHQAGFRDHLFRRQQPELAALDFFIKRCRGFHHKRQKRHIGRIHPADHSAAFNGVLPPSVFAGQSGNEGD